MKKLILFSSLLMFMIPISSKTSVKASPQEAARIVYMAQRDGFTIGYCAMIRGTMTNAERTNWVRNYIISNSGKYSRYAFRMQPSAQQIETMVRRTLDRYGGCDGALNALGYPEFIK